MKRILIYDCAAESGGALSILNSFYQKYKNSIEAEYYFVTSVIKLEENNNVHNIQLDWVKKSWIHRAFCDVFYMPFLIKNLHIDEVLSLQNIGIPRCSVKQNVYVHNAIPFCEYRFSLLKTPFLWVYQNIIGGLIYRSLKKADNVIVQTEWMKKAIVKKCNLKNSTVSVEKVVSAFPSNQSRTNATELILFYPSAALEFKNHRVIIDACKELKRRKIYGYKIVFTILGTENSLAKHISNEIKENQLPIEMIGRIDKSDMEKYYKCSTLVFPSYLETVGLPLVEAQCFNAPIIAPNLEYARDALSQYDNATFFDYSNSIELVDVICRKVEDYNK